LSADDNVGATLGLSIHSRELLSRVSGLPPDPWSGLLVSGVTSLELTMPAEPTDEHFFGFSRQLLERGFGLSFHTPYPDALDLLGFAEGSGSVGDYYRLWLGCLGGLDFAGRPPVLVVHGVNAPGVEPETHRQAFATSVAFLRWLWQELRHHEVRVHLSFEVRPHPPDSIKIGSSCAEVLTVLSEAGIDEAGVCWDIGHTMLNALRGDDTWPPPSAFVARTTHSHLHLATAQRDHLPIAFPDPFLREALTLLAGVGYSGSLTLESSFASWSEVVTSVVTVAELWSAVGGAC